MRISKIRSAPSWQPVATCGPPQGSAATEVTRSGWSGKVWTTLPLAGSHNKARVPELATNISAAWWHAREVTTASPSSEMMERDLPVSTSMAATAERARPTSSGAAPNGDQAKLVGISPWPSSPCLGTVIVRRGDATGWCRKGLLPSGSPAHRFCRSSCSSSSSSGLGTTALQKRTVASALALAKMSANAAAPLNGCMHKADTLS
mmetsp:Transcript_164902/g.529280  ORF Transcript_164902/g.529280 Transcript_164902/m.529280 type:complete len:205 (+) Transcript_164902:160-774(+)